MRPFIGVTCSSEPDGQPVVRPPYVQALHRAGAIPVALPFLETARGKGLPGLEDVLARLDGLVLTGSEDLDSVLWQEPLHPKAELMHPARQATELAVCHAVLEHELPCLAICGGMQTLNVVAGGSVIQHLPDLGSQILNHSAGFEAAPHAVRADPNSAIGRLLGASFPTNSAHHQAIGRLGRGLIASAWTEDDVIEACELPGHRFLLGVQWHPERMPEDAGQQALFRALVSACDAPVATV